MNNHTCFSFWIPDKDAAEFKKALESAQNKNGRKIGVAEVVRPAIKAFVGKNK